MLMVSSRKRSLARGPPPARPRYEPPDRRKGPVGRYDFRGDEYRPPSLGRPPRSSNVPTSVVAVADPYAPGKRLLATVNRRTDILETERNRIIGYDDKKPIFAISEAAYQAGRVAQAVFERARGPGGSNWQGGDRIDAKTASELAFLYAYETGEKVHHYLIWMRGELGKFDTALLVSILRDRKTYAECATIELEFGERGVSYIAKRFRRALQSLADSRAARGPKN